MLEIPKKFRLVFSTVTVIVFILSLVAPYILSASAADPNVIWGQVTDALSGIPIENATIAVWELNTVRNEEFFTLKTITQTGMNGSYTFSFEKTFNGRIYAYYDDPVSLGYDYLPKFQNVSLEMGDGQEINLSFNLVPAASVLFEGDIRFVDSPNQYSSYNMMIILGNEPIALKESVLSYGTTTDSHNRFLNVDQNLVIVPANTNQSIEVTSFNYAGNHSFLVGDPKLSNLSKGEKISINIDKFVLICNLKFTNDTIRFAEERVDETEKDFFVQAEKQDLEEAVSFIESAQEKISKGFYTEGYADLREAYIKATFILEKIPFMYSEAQTATMIIVIFLALTSTCLSYFFVDHWIKKSVGILFFYTVLLVILSYVFTGFQIIETQSLLIAISQAIFIAFTVAFVLPRLLPNTTTAIFSMAKNNIKRRKTRFMLTLIPIIVLIMGFVALTSFSTQYGFRSTVVETTEPNLRNLLIRNPLPEIPSIDGRSQIVFTFNPLQVSDFDWIKKKPDAVMVAPKVENYPSRTTVATLSTSSRQLQIFGILGILPSAEATITDFSSILVEGRYLRDDEEDGLLMSVDAARALNIQVGDSLELKTTYSSVEVELIGLLDDHGLEKCVDLDGSPLIPKKLVIEIQDGELITANIEVCEPSEVVIINWFTTSRLFSAVSDSTLISRIDVFVEESVDILQFSREIALERDYWVWTTVGGEMHLMALTYYLETKGASVFIPWIIVILNVIITMINAIYERRRDVAILSSVGLNPTHITSLFGAEASMIGIIGGGIGYLLGLSLYKPMAVLSANIMVRQKISAVWAMASLGIAVAAGLIGAFMALRFSVVITPSLLRKWKAKEKQSEDEWVFEIPVKVNQEQIESLLEYVDDRLQGYNSQYDLLVDKTKRDDAQTSETMMKIISFTCTRSGQGSENFVSHNKIIASKMKQDENYLLRLVCDASEEDKAYLIARFVRWLFVECSAIKKQRNPKT